MPEVGKGKAQQSAVCPTSMCSLGISWDFTAGHRGGAEVGLKEDSTGWSQRSIIRRGKGAAKELPALASRKRKR